MKNLSFLLFVLFTSRYSFFNIIRRNSFYFIVLMLSLCSVHFSFAQGTLPPNGGFENLQTYNNPNGYTITSNDSTAVDISKMNVTKVQGDNSNYAVRLETKTGTSNLTGYSLTCNVGYIYYINKKGKAGFPITGIPQSFKGRFKYNCLNGDSAVILMNFTKNGQSVSQNLLKIHGTQNVFTDKTFNLNPFSDTPDTLIIGFASSNIYNPTANKIGNWLIVDNISFPNISFQIPNKDFESWYDAKFSAPQNWNSLNSYFIKSSYTNMTTDSHSGNFAMQIRTDSTTINGTHGYLVSYITSGNFIIQNIINNNLSNIAKGGFPISSNPSSMEFFYKYYYNLLIGNDSALIITDFSKYSGGIRYNMGRFIAKLNPSISYAYQILQFNNIGNPNLPAGTQADTANIIISSSNFLSKTFNLNQCLGNNLIIDDLHFIINNTGYKLSGTVTYDNTKNTPLTSIEVYLLNSSKVKIDSTTTDASGFYQFSSSVANGTYSITAATTKTPYTPKPTEALMVNRSYIGLFTFSSALHRSAANVNNDTKVNPIDALLINRHYIQIIKSFTIPDWLFENPSVTVNGADMVVNFKGICAGDANGTFIPK